MAFTKELFRKILKETRIQRGIKVNTLAEAINKSERTIHRFESGERIPNLPTLIDICNVLEVSPDHLLNSFLTHEFEAKPTSYKQIIDVIGAMDTEELEFCLKLLKEIKKYKPR